MNALTKLTLIPLVMLGTAAMADERAPGEVEIVLDIEVASGAAAVHIDDVPFFGPGQTLDAEATIIASLPANSMLGPGQNDVLLRFTPVNSGLGNEPVFKARFGYASAGAFSDAFSDGAFAILVEIQPDPDQPGEFTLEHQVQGQPLLAGQLTASTLTALPDGALEVGLRLDVGVDLPPQEWKSGRQLADDAVTQRQLENMMRSAHAAFAAGPDTVRQELGPMLQRLAATLGMTVEEAMATEYAPFVDRSMGFELQPFEASDSRLLVMGKGRLATLDPNPVMFSNAEIGESGAPLLVYWQDADGEWKIIH